MLGKCLTTLLALIIATPVYCAESSNEWPTRPLRLVVPFAAGGAVDFVARLVADKLGATLGQSVVVDNRAGASGIIGTQAVAQSSPDGYTLLITNITHESNPALKRSLPYDTLRDFAWVSTIGALTSVLIVPASSPAKSLNDLIGLAKREPDKLNYASAGIGSINFLAAELLKKELGLKITHVPYQGGGPATTAILSGQVDMMFITPPPAVSYIKDGRVKALVVTSVARSPLLPEIPTVLELGHSALQLTETMGVAVPAATPRAVVQKLNEAINAVLADATVKNRLEAAGVTPAASTPDAFASYMRDAMARWHKVVTPEMRTE